MFHYWWVNRRKVREWSVSIVEIDILIFLSIDFDQMGFLITGELSVPSSTSMIDISSDFIRFVLAFTSPVFFSRRRLCFVLTTATRVCLYQVLCISQVESEQIILWTRSEKCLSSMCVYTNVYNHIYPEIHEFHSAFSWCCMCCAQKAHNKQQPNECIDSIFWEKPNESVW